MNLRYLSLMSEGQINRAAAWSLFKWLVAVLAALALGLALIPVVVPWRYL